MTNGIQLLGLVTGASLVAGVMCEADASDTPPAIFAPGSTILFQGDSITDGLHKGDMNHVYGHSFVWKIAASYQALRPELNLQFANRGVSGNTSSNLVQRWSTDAFPYAIAENGYEGALGFGKGTKMMPDYVSILIGVNDYFHYINKDKRGVSGPDYAQNLRTLVEKAKEANPAVRIVLCEPFRIPNDASPEFCRRQAAVADLASEFDLAFVPFQKLFSEDLLKVNPNPKYWFWDFFHPTPAGHFRMADFWIETVSRSFARQVRNTALEPRGQLEKDSYDWYERHQRIVSEQAKVDPEIVFIGDSITHGWDCDDKLRGDVRSCFAKWFGKYRTLNMGFGWDRIQNVLWRLSHGELDGTKPRVVVINIGTNNLMPGQRTKLPVNTPEEIADGIAEVCRRVREKAPHAKIVLMDVFPRDSKDTPRRVGVRAINAALASRVERLADANLVRLDLWNRYVGPDGSIPKSLMFDALHPTVKGYDIWGEALRPIVEAEVTRTVGWTFEVASDVPVVRHGAEKLRDFLERKCPPGCYEGARRVVIAVAPERNPLTSRITVTDDEVRVTGATPRETLQGCYRLMDELEAGVRPILGKGTRTYTRMFSPRMVHSGYEIEKYTDAHMDEIACAGLDAILVYVNNPPDETRNGRADFPALVKRAAEHGLDVYAYADFYWNPLLMNPCDPGAEENYDAVFGAIAKNAPGLKGIICVGESCYFPKRGDVPLKFGADRPDRSNSCKPTLDWAEFLRLVTKVTRKYSPGFDVVFWTYNWCGKPEADRVALLEAIPTNVTVHVTFEMGAPTRMEDGVEFHVDDYSITEPGPGTTFVSEAEVCARRGIPLTSMSNTGGRTWDFGGMPFEPVPYVWMERFLRLRMARSRWGLKGLMDSHHYGFVPNFVADLAKAAFTCEFGEREVAEALRALAVREFGSGCADEGLATWKDWSEAFKWHSARSYDQYGPLRLGSTYPLLRPDEPFPPSPRPVYEFVNGRRNGNGWLYLNPRCRCPDDVCEGRIRMDARELALLESGNERLASLLGKVPPDKVASVKRMLGYGRYMAAAVRTLWNVRRYRQACLAKDETERLRILDDEDSNVRGLIPWVENDPRLGFEPSMRYVTDSFMLKWKLGLLSAARGGQ